MSDEEPEGEAVDPYAELVEAMTVIANYEDSIKRPKGERWTIREKGKVAANPANTHLWNQYLEYAPKCAEYLRAGREIDKALAKSIGRHTDVLIRQNTPEILLKIGCDNLPMFQTKAHLLNEMAEKTPQNSHLHGLSLQTIKEVPELLEYPVVVSENLSDKKGIVCILNKTDDDNLPILVAFEPNGQGAWQGRYIDSNFIMTIFGKNSLDLFLSRAAAADKILFVDQKNLARLLPLAGHQLPRAYKSLNGIVRQYRPGNQAQSLDAKGAKAAFFSEMARKYDTAQETPTKQVGKPEQSQQRQVPEPGERSERKSRRGRNAR